MQDPGAARDAAAAQDRSAAVKHCGADVGQDLIGGGAVAPALMQAGVDVLHDVLGGGQVPDHKQRQPDQFAVVLAEQRAHGTRGLVG